MDWMQSNWFWFGLALGFFAAEAALPGTFLLWLGFAAAACGLVHLIFPDIASSWQWILFGVFSMVSVAVGWRLRVAHPVLKSDQPLLNKRAEQLVDQVFVLDSAIVNGRGRLKIGDAFWAAEGEETPAGTRVRVIAVEGITLRVRAIE